MAKFIDKNNPRPTPPVRPDNDECCRSGCDPCIFDLYADALDRYQVALRNWEQKQNVKKPESHKKSA